MRIPLGSPADPPPDPLVFQCESIRFFKLHSPDLATSRRPCSVRQALPFLIFQTFHPFGKALAKPLNIALLVHLLAATLESTTILFPRFIPTVLRCAPCQPRPEPRNSGLMKQNILEAARLRASIVTHYWTEVVPQLSAGGRDAGSSALPRRGWRDAVFRWRP